MSDEYMSDRVSETSSDDEGPAPPQSKAVYVNKKTGSEHSGRLSFSSHSTNGTRYDDARVVLEIGQRARKEFVRKLAVPGGTPLSGRALGKTGVTPETSFKGQEEQQATETKKKAKEDMSKPVLFYGKPSQLDDVFTYVDIKFLVDDIDDEGKQCAILASLFRGPALQWLTQNRKTNAELLDDYDTFKAAVQSAFGLTEAAQTAQTARKFANCYQKASVQLYAIEFQRLSRELNIPDATALAQFEKGLKSHIREALIVRDNVTNLEAAITEAQRIDSQLFSSKRGNTFRKYGSQGNRGTGSSGNSGKCHSCGQFGHKARDCKVKKEQPPW